MRAFRTPAALDGSTRFDAWLGDVVESEPEARQRGLERWAQAPGARESHPREEHLLPLMVTAGAAGADRGRRAFRDEVMGAVVSAFTFGG
jgi:aromatic ring-opening dioxygenase catalytic subunit (LigB family)